MTMDIETAYRQYREANDAAHAEIISIVGESLKAYRDQLRRGYIAALLLVGMVAGTALVIGWNLNRTADRLDANQAALEANLDETRVLLDTIRPELVRYDNGMIETGVVTRSSVEASLTVCFPEYLDQISLNNFGRWDFFPVASATPAQASAAIYRTTSTSRFGGDGQALIPNPSTFENCTRFDQVVLEFPEQLIADLAASPQWSPTLVVDFTVEPTGTVGGSTLPGDITTVKTTPFTVPT
jgi:hypothetical protein